MDWTNQERVGIYADNPRSVTKETLENIQYILEVYTWGIYSASNIPYVGHGTVKL